jgi:hypothetical protein
MTKFRAFTAFLPFRKDLVVGFLVLLLAGTFAAWHVSDWPVKLRYPGEQDFAEGVPLAEMVHLRQGVPIYAPPSPERFDAAIYGPLYFLLGSRLVNPDEPAYLPLRVLSLLGTVGCAAGSGLLAFWLTRSYFAAGLAPLIFLSYGFVNSHGLSARPSLVALFLFFSGFLIAYRFKGSRALLAAVPLMILGAYYKQQFVAGPLGVFLFLLLEKRYRLAAEFAGLMALGGLGLLAVFQWLVFPGQTFFRHFVIYNMLPFSRFWLSLGALYFALTFLVPLLLGLEFLRVQRDKLLGCYLGCALVVGVGTTARPGSDSNYFLELALVLSVLVASLMARNLSGPLGVSEMLVLLGVAFFFGQWFTPAAPRAEDFTRDRAVQEFLRSNFSHHAWALAPFPGDFLRAGLETPVTDPFQYSQLVLHGRLPDRDMLVPLRGRRFAVIVTHFDLRDEGIARHRTDPLPDSWREAILQEYHLVTTLEMPRPEKPTPEERFYIWVPRPCAQGSGVGSTP